MKGKIGFDDLKISCIIGVNPEERIVPQILYMDLRVEIDFARCAASDNVNDTVDYTGLAFVCADLALNRRYQLLEALAADILRTFLAYPGISSAWVCIKKPNGLPTAKNSVVEMELKK